MREFAESHFVQHFDEFYADDQARAIVCKVSQTLVTLPEDLREIYCFLDRLTPCLGFEGELHGLTASCYRG
jgi:hypothetical protein